MQRDQSAVTAFHEAGHVISAWICEVDVTRISINPHDGMLGHVMYNFSQHQRELLEQNDHNFLSKLTIMSLSGMTADYIHWNNNHVATDDELSGHYDDQQKAQSYLQRIGKHGNSYLDAYTGGSLKIIQHPRNWQTLEKLANRVLDKKILYAHDMIDLVNEVDKIKDDFWEFVELLRS